MRFRSEPRKPVLIGGLIDSPNTSWEEEEEDDQSDEGDDQSDEGDDDDDSPRKEK
jgi:hypothetical protein